MLHNFAANISNPPNIGTPVIPRKTESLAQMCPNNISIQHTDISVLFTLHNFLHNTVRQSRLPAATQPRKIQTQPPAIHMLVFASQFLHNFWKREPLRNFRPVIQKSPLLRPTNVHNTPTILHTYFILRLIHAINIHDHFGQYYFQPQLILVLC